MEFHVPDNRTYRFVEKDQVCLQHAILAVMGGEQVREITADQTQISRIHSWCDRCLMEYHLIPSMASASPGHSNPIEQTEQRTSASNPTSSPLNHTPSFPPPDEADTSGGEG